MAKHTGPGQELVVNQLAERLAKEWTLSKGTAIGVIEKLRWIVVRLRECHGASLDFSGSDLLPHFVEIRRLMQSPFARAVSRALLGEGEVLTAEWEVVAGEHLLVFTIQTI